jgi:two-component system OmpR family sensor kinase
VQRTDVSAPVVQTEIANLPLNTRNAVNLATIAGEAVDAIRTVDGDRTFDFQAEPGVTVLGDADQLRQMIDNLLTNAHVHTPAGTAVSITVTCDDGLVRLVVADDGRGRRAQQLRVRERPG